MKRIIFSIILMCNLCTMWAVGQSGIYQHSVALAGYISTETGKAPTAYIWIPEGCQTVKAVVLAQQNMTEEMLYKRAVIEKLEFSRRYWALLGIDSWKIVIMGKEE